MGCIVFVIFLKYEHVGFFSRPCLQLHKVYQFATLWSFSMCGRYLPSCNTFPSRYNQRILRPYNMSDLGTRFTCTQLLRIYIHL